MRRTSGFTLLEVLVAVAVLAIALSAVIKVTSESGGNASSLRDKTLAHWVAENKLAEMIATGVWAEGEQKGSSELAGREWFWRVETKNTADKDLRQVTIRVSDQERGNNSLTVLNGFLGNPDMRKPSRAAAPPGQPPSDDQSQPGGDQPEQSQQQSQEQQQSLGQGQQQQSGLGGSSVNF